MTRDDVRRLLNITKHPSICIAIDTLDRVPGYVRSVYIRPPSTIWVEYEIYGLDEGGDYYVGEYATLDDAIDAAAQFTGKPIDTWEDLENAGYYPPRVADANLQEGHTIMSQLRNTHTAPLPSGTMFVRKG